MDIQLVLLAQIAVGFVVCLPTLIASTVRTSFGTFGDRSARPGSLMGRTKYAFYTA